MTKRKRKWGALDIVILVIVLAVIGAAVYYFTHNNVGDSAASSGDTDVTYVVEIKDVDEDIENIVVIGDDLYYTESGAYIGEITSVERVPYYVDAYQQDTGTMVSEDVDGKYNVKVTVSARADVSESETSVNGVPVMVGSALNVNASTFGGNGYCVELEVANNGD